MRLNSRFQSTTLDPAIHRRVRNTLHLCSPTTKEVRQGLNIVATNKPATSALRTLQRISMLTHQHMDLPGETIGDLYRVDLWRRDTCKMDTFVSYLRVCKGSILKSRYIAINSQQWVI